MGRRLFQIIGGARPRTVELSQLSANIWKLVYHTADKVYWPNEMRLYERANGFVTVGWTKRIGAGQLFPSKRSN